MGLGRYMYINNLNTVLSDQQQKKKRLFARSASGMFSKSGSPLAFFHKFGSWGGGGVRSHPSHSLPPRLLSHWRNTKPLSENTREVRQCRNVLDNHTKSLVTSKKRIELWHTNRDKYLWARRFNFSPITNNKFYTGTVLNKHCSLWAQFPCWCSYPVLIVSQFPYV